MSTGRAVIGIVWFAKEATKLSQLAGCDIPGGGYLEHYPVLRVTNKPTGRSCDAESRPKTDCSGGSQLSTRPSASKPPRLQVVWTSRIIRIPNCGGVHGATVAQTHTGTPCSPPSCTPNRA